MELSYRLTMNLTADFAGIDRPLRDAEETERLRRQVMVFSEGATLVHSTRDKETVRNEVRAALAEFKTTFYEPSLARRQLLVADFAAGKITEEDVPRDVLTVLLKNDERVEMAPDLMMREIAFTCRRVRTVRPMPRPMLFMMSSPGAPRIRKTGNGLIRTPVPPTLRP